MGLFVINKKRSHTSTTHSYDWYPYIINLLKCKPLSFLSNFYIYLHYTIPTSCVLFLNPLSSLSIRGYKMIYSSMGNLSGAVSLKRTYSSSTLSHLRMSIMTCLPPMLEFWLIWPYAGFMRAIAAAVSAYLLPLALMLFHVPSSKMFPDVYG